MLDLNPEDIPKLKYPIKVIYTCYDNQDRYISTGYDILLLNSRVIDIPSVMNIIQGHIHPKVEYFTIDSIVFK